MLEALSMRLKHGSVQRLFFHARIIPRLLAPDALGIRYNEIASREGLRGRCPIGWQPAKAPGAGTETAPHQDTKKSWPFVGCGWYAIGVPIHRPSIETNPCAFIAAMQAGQTKKSSSAITFSRDRHIVHFIRRPR